MQPGSLHDQLAAGDEAEQLLAHPAWQWYALTLDHQVELLTNKIAAGVDSWDEYTALVGELRGLQAALALPHRTATRAADLRRRSDV